MADAVLPPIRLALITRLRTPNKGNEALSAECLRALAADPRVAKVDVLERVPPYTLRFSTERLRRARSIEDQVARWTEAALSLERSAEQALQPLPPEVRLDERALQRGGAVSALKRKLAVRSRLARLGRYDAAYGRRLRLVSECGVLVLNAAGEFWETADDVPVRHLLDLHSAQAMGCRTAIINHTFSLRDPTVLKLAGLVYRKLDYISVRDDASKAALAALGVPPDQIAVAADLVFLTEPGDVPATAPAGRVALCPNTALRASLEQSWGSLIGALQSRGIGCALCSNDFPTDGPLLEALSRRYSLPIAGRGLGYRDYAAMLGSFDAVVSGRLHTGVLAIVASTPLIPVEGLTFKVTAAMAEIDNPFATVNFGDAGWLDEALASIDAALGGGASARSKTAEVAQRQRLLAARHVADLVDALTAGAQR